MRQKSMKLTVFIMTAMLLIICASSLNGYCRQDSTSSAGIVLSIDETKDISKLLTEVEYRRNLDSLNNEQIALQKDIIDLLVKESEMNSEKEAEYVKRIKELEPAWWDKFYVGAGTVLSAVIVIIMVIR